MAPADKSLISNLRQEGLSLEDIASRVGISNRRVSQILLQLKLGYYPYLGSRERYSKSSKRRIVQRRYEESDKGKATISRYQTSDKFKKALKRYYRSEKGRIAYKKGRERRRKLEGQFLARVEQLGGEE